MELTPGAAAVYRCTFSQEDFDRFAALSGDDNPIHVDPAFAAATRFGRTVAHGMMLYSTLCAALTREVGPDYVQHNQELMFVTPTYTGEEITVRLEVTAASADGHALSLSTAITRPDGAIACQGSTRLGRVAAPRDAPTRSAVGAFQSGGERHPSTAFHSAQDASRPLTEVHPPAITANQMSATSYKGLRLGQAVEVTRTFTAADLGEYVALTGDDNPAYATASDSQSAAHVPGGLLGGLFSYLLGTRLPGRGTNWLKQSLVFPEPARVGEPIRARVEIVRLRPEKDLVNLATTCTLVDGEAAGAAFGRIVCHGEALVLVKDLEERPPGHKCPGYPTTPH